VLIALEKRALLRVDVDTQLVHGSREARGLPESTRESIERPPDIRILAIGFGLLQGA